VYLEGQEEDMKWTLGIVLLAVAMGIGAGCKDRAGEAALAELGRMKAEAEEEARNVELVKTAIAALEKGEVDVFTELFAPGFKLYFPSGSTAPISREDAMGMARMMVTAVPDLAYGIRDIFAAGDRVAVRLVFQGTHRPSTGKAPSALTRIMAGAMVIFRVKDGLITEETIDGDALGLFRQLGLELQPKVIAK
jgi:predicted ester cyclase